MKCRHCGFGITLTLIDLGTAPFSNAYLSDHELRAAEPWYPLSVVVCERCWLAQIENPAHPSELFKADYAYFSSFSTTWLKHAQSYVNEIVSRFALTTESHIVEVASNDGYLLQYVKARNIRCTGIEPTASTAAASRAKGIDTREEFFGTDLARRLVAENKSADFIVANNVLAHVPDINDFVAGFALLLKRSGVAAFEFPHLAQLIAENQFDTIYHEHFSYLSLTAVQSIFEANGLSVFDVEEQSTHGGSLRVFAQRQDVERRPPTENVRGLLEGEKRAGVSSRGYYETLQGKAETIKDDLLRFLIDSKRANKRVAAYGAAAKGNTLMNFAGIRQDLIKYVVDRNPAKQGRFMPGSRIPIVGESLLYETKPDYVVILPWNIKAEVIEQLGNISSWGAKFVTAVPALEII